jgi:hypothetical protein
MDHAAIMHQHPVQRKLRGEVLSKSDWDEWPIRLRELQGLPALEDKPVVVEVKPIKEASSSDQIPASAVFPRIAAVKDYLDEEYNVLYETDQNGIVTATIL